jgi:hypothetical protein
LTVKPRGIIRWNTNGTNPKEGAVYTVPIELTGTGEVTIYAYAEDKGASTQRNFLIPRVNETGPSIDTSKQAKLRKKIDFRGTTDAFRAINAAKSMQVMLAGGVFLSVGEGATAVTTRFGSDAAIKAEDVEAFIALARQALANPLADVVLRVENFHFVSGRDLETFASRLGLDIEAGEVEQ